MAASIPRITASQITSPPPWAVLQRSIFELSDKATAFSMAKYSERSGSPYYADDMDDLYERAYNWGHFYALGGSKNTLDRAIKFWNAVTRWGDSRYASRPKHPHWMRGDVREDFRQQITNEYWNTATPHGAEWHHQGEANHSFYGFGLADPTISENVRRARRFAAMFIGEDPDAPNWDPVHKIIRSPMHGSTGPHLKSDVDEVAWWLFGGKPPHPPSATAAAAPSTPTSMTCRSPGTRTRR